VEAYIDIVREHHPEIIARNTHFEEPSSLSDSHPT